MVNNMNEINKKVLKEAKWEFIVNIINSVLHRAAVLIIPVVWSYAIDEINANRYNNAINLIILSLIITVIYYVLEQWYQHTIYKLYNKLYNKYENIYSEAFYKNSLFSLSRFSLGEYNNLLNGDIDVIASYYANLPMRVIRIVEFLVIYLYFFNINKIIFVITLITSLISLGYMLYSTKETERLNKLRKDDLDIKTGSNHEIYLNIRDMKSFNLYDKILNKTNEKRLNYLKSNAKFNIQSIGAKNISLVIVEVVRLLVMIYGVYLIKGGLLEIGALLIVYNYYQKIVDNYTIVSNILINQKSLKVSLIRFSKILENANYEVLKDEDFNIEGTIEFNNILYGYRDNPTLKDTSFTIYKNATNIITGPTGSGKSGVVDLLLKMNRPHSGTITIDGINIFEINSEDYYNMIACVSSAPTFFNDSIKNNLLLVSDDFDYAQLVCKRLKIHDYIVNLPNGYDTNINSDIKSSIKALLAIARVIIKDSKIMIFDECMSSLDKNDEKVVKEIFNELEKDHTIIIVSRENNFNDISDNIITIENHTCTNQKKK